MFNLGGIFNFQSKTPQTITYLGPHTLGETLIYRTIVEIYVTIHSDYIILLYILSYYHTIRFHVTDINYVIFFNCQLIEIIEEE